MNTIDAPQIIELEQKSLTYTPNDIKWLPGSAKYVVVGVTPSNNGIIEVREMDLMKEARVLPTSNDEEHSKKSNTANCSNITKDKKSSSGDVSVLRRIVFPTPTDRLGTGSSTSDSSSGVRCCHFGTAPSLDARHLAYGTAHGTLSIIDLEHQYHSTDELSHHNGTAPQDQSSSNNQPPELWGVQNAHNGMINAIDGMGGLGSGRTGLMMGPPELVTGGRDGCVKVWDVRVDCSSRTSNGTSGQPVCSLEPDPNKIQNPRDCWTVAFGNAYDEKERSVVAGFDNGDIKMFDLRTNHMVWEMNIENAITCIEFDRPDIRQNKLLVTSLESRFHMYNLRTKEGFAYKKELAHKSTIWCGKFSPQNREIFVTCGGNGGLNIYKYHYTPRVSSSKGDKKNHSHQTKKKHPIDGHEVGAVGYSELLNSRILSTQPINSFDWSPDQNGLCAMTSFDQTVRVQMISKLDKY